jgi:hypothetical protein
LQGHAIAKERTETCVNQYEGCSMRRTRTILTVCLALPLLSLPAGCAPQPTKKPAVKIEPPTYEPPPPPPSGPDPYKMTAQEVESTPLASDIVQVNAHYGLFPWLQFDPTDPRPQGFMVSSLFLVSGKTSKGAFADGLITVRLYRVDRDAQRRETRTLVHSWQYTPEQAMPFRAVKRTVVGLGYQLHLRWPAELDLVNREIVVIIEFTRLDGKTVSSSAKFLKVPDKVNG